MPKVTIWVRNEDYDKWKAIENRPDWLHRRLYEVLSRGQIGENSTLGLDLLNDPDMGKSFYKGTPTFSTEEDRDEPAKD